MLICRTRDICKCVPVVDFFICLYIFVITPGHINLLPSFPEFPVPKNELVQRFNVNYLGNVPVAKPVGKERLGKESFHTHIPHRLLTKALAFKQIGFDAAMLPNGGCLWCFLRHGHHQ